MNIKKNYLITGATSALGTAIAFSLIEKFRDECNLLLVSRSHSKELELLENSNVIYLSGVDLLGDNINDQILPSAKKLFEGSFNLIHSAGDFWFHNSFFEINTSEAQKMMDSHYGTLYNVLQNILPLMIKNGGGKVLTFSCNASEYNFPNMLPFTAAKTAVDATIKCIAHEFANKNIVANSIALSSLKTPHNKDSKPNGDFDNYLDLRELSYNVIEIAELSNGLVNGNVIHCYKHSDSYYNEGYFQRIKQN